MLAFLRSGLLYEEEITSAGIPPRLLKERTFCIKKKDQERAFCPRHTEHLFYRLQPKLLSELSLLIAVLRAMCLASPCVLFFVGLHLLLEFFNTAINGIECLKLA